ncbi:MAG: hypothetical protein JSR66_29125 [Proteobacteria bacterium]|nr:hypothetical protein [Pseudomonadota bacterium]
MIPAPAATRSGLATAGWVLFAMSWITPSSDGRQIGAVAFVESPRFAWNLLTTGNIALGLCVLAGWLANFSIVPRLPPWARVLACLAPWLAFTVVLLQLPVRPSLPGRAAFFLYFYPWAAGIALIHAAHWRKAAATGARQ